MTVVFARGEVAGNHLAPEHARQRLTQQTACSRVGFAHHTLPVQHHHPTGQQVQQALQAMGQALLLGELLHALGTDQGQLPFQLGDPRLHHGVGLAQLRGHLIEQRKRLFQIGAHGRFSSNRQWQFSDGGGADDWVHTHLSHGEPSFDGLVQED